MKEPTVIKQLSILRVKPDDVIVLMYDGILPEHVRNNLHEMVKSVPALKDHHVIVLEDGLKIAVVREVKE